MYSTLVTYRVVGYFETEEQYRLLKMALAMERLTFSEWLRVNAESYVQSRLRGNIRLVDEPTQAHQD